MSSGDPSIDTAVGADPRVLVVAHGHTCAPILFPEELDILHAATTSAAFDMLACHDLAVVILDLRQPTPEGVLLAELICQSPAYGELPIVVLGGAHGGPWEALRREHAGLLDVLHASAPSDHLQAKVRLFLELHRQRRWLEEAALSLAQSRDHLIATLTHDLRTPLSSVMLCAEKLSFDLRGNVHVRRTLGHLHASANGLACVLERLPPVASVDGHAAPVGWIDSAPAPCDEPGRLHCAARRMTLRPLAEPLPSRLEASAVVGIAADQGLRTVHVSRVPATRR
ncbi:hypothetical protein KQ945_05580 [Bacillus subtilis subsp. subtilis]|nr:hypothetical protein [Bacillus subtilis subsp. subtilis]